MQRYAQAGGRRIAVQGRICLMITNHPKDVMAVSTAVDFCMQEVHAGLKPCEEEAVGTVDWPSPVI